jgi:hypothetical protein
MAGAVGGSHDGVLCLDVDSASGTGKKGAEGMVAALARTLRDGYGAPQQIRVSVHLGQTVLLPGKRFS